MLGKIKRGQHRYNQARSTAVLRATSGLIEGGSDLAMQHADFTIGTEFETSTGQRWRCTDVGQRTILAIELRPELDPAWFIGPPYSLEEVVFDEQDIASAFRSQDDAIRAVLTRLDQGAHPGYPHAAVNRMMRARYLESSRRYPYPRLLRIDRVDATGEILHPYAVEPVPDGDGWRILVYAPFIEAFSTLPEAEFVRLRTAGREDFEARKQI